jgi:PKD repeat protein
MLAPLAIAGWTLFVSGAPAQIAPRILHEGLGCIVAGQHAVVDALVEPPDDLVTVKVYFRAEIYPAFFYVEAVPNGDRHQAILPRPTRDVASVVYYLEAVDSAFNSFRTEEFQPRVVQDAADCREDEPQPVYVDGPASITVGATAAGSTFPPGFLTEGIVGTITAAGRAAGGGSATLIGIGAAAGAAAGVGLLVGGGDAGTTTVPAAGGLTTSASVTTTVATTTSTAPVGSSLTACFDTSPNPPTIPVGEAVRFDASCSLPRDQIVTYSWDFNDGRDGRDGRVVTRQYASAGVFPAELTVTNAAGSRATISKEVRVQDSGGGPGPSPGPGPTSTVPGSADLQVTGLNNPSPNVNANVNYTVSYRSAGPDLDPSVSLVISFNAAGAGGAPVPISTPGCGSSSGAGSLTVSCSLGSLAPGAAGSKAITVRFPSRDTYSVTATIFGGTSDPNPGNDSRSVSTRVNLKMGDLSETTFLSEVQANRPVQTSIELNGLASPGALGEGPSRHRMKPVSGPNVLAGFASGASLEGALWKLDFSATEGFVPGSLAIDAGEVVSASPYTVVFRLGGNETRIRLRFRMEP